ncbi:protein translocase subunit SecD [Acinetobacter sp. MD2]|uniref:protein translocase subunit SecD n=1 Tax=Acinetobacter sp. MD2 TaxID=2600066 RepID=UPI002D1E5BF6|nr:protein translocase subunit SecD [Acinetobacter sp. MD2]MEB3768360.1 protein translocase subunit SecD [Acinetobacter sp. MD2]
MRYPAWKYLLIIVVLIVSTLYALPSLYPDEPAVQISGAKAGTKIDQSILQKAEQILKSQNISSHDNSFTNNAALLRVNSTDAQLKAKEALRQLGDDYVVALNLAPTTPEWLQKIGAKPMKLGLDLRGGVHFLLEVDMDKAIAQRMDTSSTDLRRQFRDNNIKFNNLALNNNVITVQFANNDDRDAAMSFLRRNGNEFSQQAIATDTGPTLRLSYTDVRKQEIQSYAVNQNLTTLRNRINELGVAEALVQTQGNNRIVVELPGVQDTAEAKRVLGRTANLEFRLVSDQNDQYIDQMTGKYNGQPLPAGTEVFAYQSLDSGRQLLLNRNRILTGERVQNASSNLSTDTGGAEVNITLDNAGGKLMSDATRSAIGKRMAVLFIENKQKISYVTDPQTHAQTEVRTPYTESVVINAATVQQMLGSQFRITGLSSPQEASELALMLRSGALAAPMYFVEERVVGPSLGQENIDKGILSTEVGFILVAIWMIAFFRLFGLIANFALVVNLAMILAVMSLLGASLSLPGIAGIIITIGMAVDANVLICERIREEIKWGASPKQAIVAGYDRAYNTIIDSNLTTFIVAFILFAIGSGPIKSFAVTHMIGIVCSMFTSITVTRAIVQLVYGKRRNLTKLSI